MTQILSLKVLLLILGAITAISAAVVAHEHKKQAEEVQILQHVDQSMQSVRSASERTIDTQPKKYEAPRLP